jgi:4'-phosphopantetheinyl transferase
MSSAAALAVWHIDVARAAPALAENERRCPRLSHDEEARAAAMPDPREAVIWRTTRIALRLLLESVAGADMRRVPFAAGAAGKPRLARHRGALDFSLSHCGGDILIAIAGAGPVGIDLERLRAVSMEAERRRALIAAAAALVPASIPDEDPTDAHLLQAWVRLEALAKARGCGIGLLFRDFGLSGGRRQGAAAAGQAAGRLVREAGLKVCDLTLPTGLFGAIAARGDAATPITVHPFPNDCTRLAGPGYRWPATD